MSPDYFDQLEAELRNAVARISDGLGADGSRQARRRRWWRRAPLLALNAAIVVAVAVVLIVELGHQHPERRSPAPSSLRGGLGPSSQGAPQYPPGADPTLAQLLANFAILRRGQTPADRSWKPVCSCGGAATQLWQYTRLARALPGGARVFFDVERLTVGQDDLPAGSYLMNLDVVASNGNVIATSFGPNTGFTIYPSRVGDHVYVGAVPDGVSTVTWRFSCRGGGTTCAGERSFSVTASVANNVAASQVRKPTCLDGPELTPAQRRHPARVRQLMTHCDRPTQTTWRDAAGQVVASFPQGIGNLAAAPFVKGARVRPRLKILRSDGVGPAAIGQTATAAERGLVRLLGARTLTKTRVAGCRQETEAVWTSPASAYPLTIYERNGRFIGYQYGAPTSETGLVRGPGTLLSTSRGLTLGITVGRARLLYGTAFHARAVRGLHNNGGGRWSVVTGGTTLDGALMPIRYPMRTVTNANPIATIAAGQTGCP